MTRQELEKMYKMIEDDSYYNGSIETQNRAYEELDQYFSDIVKQWSPDRPDETARIKAVWRYVLSTVVRCGDEVREEKKLC